ncbi:MAG: c-type cytochrome [Pseudomonadota bacterium]
MNGFKAGIAACLFAVPQLAGANAAGDFRQYCVSCHGLDGKGNGPAGADLSPRPADLTGIAARSGGIYPMAEVMSAIDGYGQSGEGRAMPEFGAYLLDDEQVLVDTGDGIRSPAPKRLVEMAEYLRSLQR